MLSRFYIFSDNEGINHPILAFICPYQQFSSTPVIIRNAGDFTLAAFETCPPPLKGIKTTITTIGYPPYVLYSKPNHSGNRQRKKQQNNLVFTFSWVTLSC